MDKLQLKFIAINKLKESATTTQIQGNSLKCTMYEPLTSLEDVYFVGKANYRVMLPIITGSGQTFGTFFIIL